MTRDEYRARREAERARVDAFTATRRAEKRREIRGMMIGIAIATVAAIGLIASMLIWPDLWNQPQ